MAEKAAENSAQTETATETKDAGSEEQVASTTQTEESTGTETETEGEGFNKKQLQQIGSLVGKIVKSHKPDESEESTETSVESETQGTQPNAMDQFNIKVSEKLFGGDPMGAFQMMRNVQTKADQNVSQAQTLKTDKLIISYSEKPYYKEVYKDMTKSAHALVAEGYPPEAACRTAYAEVVGTHVQAVKVGEGEGQLEMLDSGRHLRDKSTKLTGDMKEAAARDIEQGLYKDEKEWVAAMNPGSRDARGV